eukprot:scaffold84090_cov66-Phaeocystis_antarctica.AAC.2
MPRAARSHCSSACCSRACCRRSSAWRASSAAAASAAVRWRSSSCRRASAARHSFAASITACVAWMRPPLRTPLQEGCLLVVCKCTERGIWGTPGGRRAVAAGQHTPSITGHVRMVAKLLETACQGTLRKYRAAGESGGDDTRCRCGCVAHGIFQSASIAIRCGGRTACGPVEDG